MTRSADYDLLVVGAGPAGIAAATRARWVKRHHAIPCKVAIIDPAPAGGLTRMGTCIMTGPAWIYTNETIEPLLVSDLERLEIPQLRQRACAIAHGEDGALSVSLDSGQRVSAHAVILACGMKTLHREAELWNRGVTATSMGFEWAASKVKRWVSSGEYRHIVFVGSDKLTNLIAFVDEHRAPGTQVSFVLEPIVGVSEPSGLVRDDVFHGIVSNLEGGERLTSVHIVGSDGGTRQLPADLLVVDFLSYEVRPSRSVSCPELVLDESGFIVVDRKQRTNIPGLFAAGDATGMPACAGAAIGEGIVAGFEAYRFVYRAKFGCEAPLFAYYGRDEPLTDANPDLPAVGRGTRAELLVSVPTILAALDQRAAPQGLVTARRTLSALSAMGEGAHAVEVVAARAALPVSDVASVVTRLLEMKLATVRGGPP